MEVGARPPAPAVRRRRFRTTAVSEQQVGVEELCTVVERPCAETPAGTCEGTVEYERSSEEVRLWEGGTAWECLGHRRASPAARDALEGGGVTPPAPPPPQSAQPMPSHRVSDTKCQPQRHL